MRHTYETSLQEHISSQFIFHVARNEAKRTDDLTEVMEKLKVDVSKYTTVNDEQNSMLVSLQKQMQGYDRINAAEKQYLQNQILNLEQELQRKGRIDNRRY